jgi:glycosyltransferase involved in cell wall biosynthesis
MRIAFIAQPMDRLDPPVQDGSLAIWIYQVARRCATRGHGAFVFASHGSATRASITQHENVQYIFTPTILNAILNRSGETVVRLAASWGGRSALPSFAASWRDFAYAFEAVRRLKRLRCDAAFIMNYSQFVPVIRRLYPECRIYLYMQCEWLTQLHAETMSARIAQADLVGGCSEYITRTIAEKFPQYANKCVTLNNAGIPAQPGGNGQRDPRNVLFVGRVSPEKGVHDLVDAFHLVLQRHPLARLHIVGGAGSAPLEFLVGLSDDPHVARLRRFYGSRSEGGKDPYLLELERAAGAELGTRIIFHGRVDHDKTFEAYQRASVLVNPSLSESFGMTLVESMMHEVPVVATRVGGMPYIVDEGETGFLVDPADPQALSHAICEALGDPARARQMGKVAKMRVMERFTWDRTTDTLLQQLGSLLE